MKLRALLHRSPPFPPARLRSGSRTLLDDAVYAQSARDTARRLTEAGLVSPTTRVLDVGCGPGRLLIGLSLELGAVQSYVGLDVDREKVEWAARHLATRGHSVAFHHLDVQNERYQADGAALKGPQTFPVEDAQFDLAVLNSVFSHMRFGDVQKYLWELHRVLTSTGRVFCTAFVEDDVPLETENPRDYLQTWSGPLHCVRFERSSFNAAVEQAGFRFHSFDYRDSPDLQSTYVLAPANQVGTE